MTRGLAPTLLVAAAVALSPGATAAGKAHQVAIEGMKFVPERIEVAVGDSITWVTASVAYKVFDGLTVSLEGRNLADAYYSANLGRNDILAGFETWGRTVILGVNARF